MNKLIALIIFLSITAFLSCEHRKNNITEKIIKEEIIKTNSGKELHNGSIDQIKNSVESIKDRDIPDIKKKNLDDK